MADREYKYAEYILYNFTHHLVCIEILTHRYKELKERGDVKVQNYQLQYDRRIRDPVYEHLARMIRLQSHINELNKKVIPVKKLILSLEPQNTVQDDYNENLMNIINYIYIGRNSVNTVSEALKLSRRTIYRRKRVIVKRLIKML